MHAFALELTVHRNNSIYRNNLLYTPDAAPLSVARFHDGRCSAGGVCSTDPILFTCELKEVLLLRVMLPSGDQEITSFGETVADVALSAGFAAVALKISVSEFTLSRNISLTLFIANASLLEYGVIRCDDTTKRNVVMAGCPLLGKS